MKQQFATMYRYRCTKKGTIVMYPQNWHFGTVESHKSDESFSDLQRNEHHLSLYCCFALVCHAPASSSLRPIAIEF